MTSLEEDHFRKILIAILLLYWKTDALVDSSQSLLALLTLVLGGKRYNDADLFPLKFGNQMLSQMIRGPSQRLSHLLNKVCCFILPCSTFVFSFLMLINSCLWQ